MNILSLNHVSYQYKGASDQVFEPITMDFQSGKVYAITGRSGAGKTTLLALLSGLELPTEGQITYRGEDLKTMNRDFYRARSIGTVFQGYHLLTNATALDHITLAMDVSGDKRKDKKKAALELLHRVGIDGETAKRKVLQLSGGEQQRVGIARALSHDPDLILADEPTGNLDGETEKTILDILSGLAHHDGKCVIIVTHSETAAKYADQLLRLDHGKLN